MTYYAYCKRCLRTYEPVAGTNICKECQVDLINEAEKTEAPAETSMDRLITEECEDIAGMLRGKNKAYGDSAMNPVRVFSKADKVEQLKVRIDDKLSRLARGQAQDEDVILDLIGYLILLRIANRNKDK